MVSTSLDKFSYRSHKNMKSDANRVNVDVPGPSLFFCFWNQVNGRVECFTGKRAWVAAHLDTPERYKGKNFHDEITRLWQFRELFSFAVVAVLGCQGFTYQIETNISFGKINSLFA